LLRATRLSAVALTAVGVVAASLVAASPAAASDTVTTPPTATTTTKTTTSTPTTAAVTRIVTRARMTTRQRTIHRGQRAWLTASVTYGAHATRVTGIRVYLQHRTKGHWRTIASKPLSSRGYATFAVKPQWSTAYRVIFPSGHGRFTGSTSATQIVRLTPWPASALRAKVVRAAARQVGKPYVFGAAGPRAFDCSGLTQYAFRAAGVKLSHQSTSQASRGRRISRTAARAGDLVVFWSGGYAYHVAVYAGGGYVYEASNPGQPIGKHRLWSSSVSFRRLVG
jgi:cell wall-associated NlpC family hydrolase